MIQKGGFNSMAENEKKFNVLIDEWIVAKRLNGETEKIAPWQITSNFKENPVVELQTYKEDHLAALYEFLIGIFTTFYTPKDAEEWKEKNDSPPTPDELFDIFSPVSKPFEMMDGNKPFMQENTDEVKQKKLKSLDLLEIDSPPENLINEFRNLFKKQGQIEFLCPACSALSLFNLQINAQMVMHHNPECIKRARLKEEERPNSSSQEMFCTQLKGNSVWQTVWSNTLDLNSFETFYGMKPELIKPGNMSKCLPWLRNFSSGDRQPIGPEDTHLFEMFWPLPRRMIFEWEERSEPSFCDYCGEQTLFGVVGFRRASSSKTFRYIGPWIHPLVPYKIEDNKREHCKLPSMGFYYRDWGNITFQEAHRNLKPAFVIQRINNMLIEVEREIWAYGFKLFGSKNNKIGTFYQSMFPKIEFDKNFHKQLFQFHAEQMIKLAEHIKKLSITALYRALRGTKKPQKWDWVFPDGQKYPDWRQGIYREMEISFWKTTEEKFFELVRNLQNSIEENSSINDIKKTWFDFLKEQAFRLFEEYSKKEIDEFNRERLFAWKSMKREISPWDNGIQQCYEAADGEPFSILYEENKEVSKA